MSSPGEAPQLGAMEARDLVASGAAAVDVREPDEWHAGHMAGSTWIPLGELGRRLDELPSGPLVIVCRTGSRSGMVADALVGAGLDARNLAGGLVGWVAAGLPLEPADGRVL
jgi:rhodanese-related sulfurtransferase